MERPPLPRPPFGLHDPIEVVRVIDGDTVECRGSFLPGFFHVRLLEVDAPEVTAASAAERLKAKAARQLTEKLVLDRKGVSLFIPMPESPENFLRQITSFGRVLGHVYVDEHTLLADELVREGLAKRS